jgi:hypothetical protein
MCFDQCGHHQVLTLLDEEITVFVSFLMLLIYNFPSMRMRV